MSDSQNIHKMQYHRNFRRQSQRQSLNQIYHVENTVHSGALGGEIKQGPLAKKLFSWFSDQKK